MTRSSHELVEFDACMFDLLFPLHYGELRKEGQEEDDDMQEGRAAQPKKQAEEIVLLQEEVGLEDLDGEEFVVT